MRSTLVGPPTAESLVSGQRGPGKDGGMLDSTNVRADRPKNTNGHSVTPQTTGRTDWLAVAGGLPRGLTMKAAGLGEGPPTNVLFAETRNLQVPCLRYVPTHNDGQRYDLTTWCSSFGDPLRRKSSGSSASKGPTIGDRRSPHPALNYPEAGSVCKTTHARNVNILQWSAGGVYTKTIALVERLHEENIGVECIQETTERVAAFQHQGISGI